jgi:hypothetical protein
VASTPAARQQVVPAPALKQEAGHIVQAPHVNNPSLDKMLRVVTVVQQIMTEVSSAVSEEEKVKEITKRCS